MSESPASSGRATRRPHPKVRSGCRTCKARRVKCDEARPTCGNCLRRGDACEFYLQGTRPSGSTPGETTHTPSPRPEQFDPSGSGPFTLLDMELLHHFITSTCLTFSTDPAIRVLWRIDVIQMGLRYPFLLKTLLALAALHLARTQPERTAVLVETAMMYQTSASSMALPLLSNIPPEATTPIFVFSSNMLILAFASPKHANDQFAQSPSGLMPDFFSLLRGVRTMHEVDKMQSDPNSFSAAFSRGGAETSRIWDMAMLNHEALVGLETKLRSHVADQTKLALLLREVEELKRCYHLIYENDYGDDHRTRAVVIWLFKAEDEFVQLLEQQDSEALCVLTFLCVPLHRLGYHWWLDGWGRHLLSRIYQVLPPMYRSWIRWPIEEIN